MEPLHNDFKKKNVIRFDCLVMIQLRVTLVFSITEVQVYFVTWRIAWFIIFVFIL